MKPQSFVTNFDGASAYSGIKDFPGEPAIVVPADAQPLSILAALDSRLHRISSILEAVDGVGNGNPLVDAINPGIEEAILLSKYLLNALTMIRDAQDYSTDE